MIVSEDVKQKILFFLNFIANDEVVSLANTITNQKLDIKDVNGT